jgi:hypothetical protein
VPYSDNHTVDQGRGRDPRETGLRNFALWFIDTGYVVALPALTLVALAIAGYGFTVSFGEGTRSLIFFVIPVMWGAYTLAVNDGSPQVIEKLADKAVVGVAVVAALIIGLVFILNAPVSIADLAFGAMVAFFFLMWTSDQPSRFQRRPSKIARTWMLALLVMITILAFFAAVAL